MATKHPVAKSFFYDPLNTPAGRWMLILVVLFTLLLVFRIAMHVRPHPLMVLDRDAQYSTDGSFIYEAIDPIMGADTDSFRVLVNGYATDEYRAYYYGKVIYMAQPKSFEILQNGYAKDAAHVFYQENMVPGSDAASFTILGGSMYAKDNGTVYYSGSIIQDADAASFKLADYYTRGYDAKDKNNMYANGTVITPDEAKKNLLSAGY